MNLWTTPLLTLALLLACSSDPEPQDTASPQDTAQTDTTPPNDTAADDTTASTDTAAGDTTTSTPTPTNRAELEPFLTAQDYLAWTPEPTGQHESAGPHFGQVRVFINPTLAASLADGNTTHPQGSAAVKELYGSSSTPLGFSYWVKLDPDSADGANLYWYEVYNDTEYADAQGSSLCTGCHSGGNDFLLSTGF